ncbi:unnamed protein product [Rhizoctonia solani]|uniref:Uncharacterized protein n=1 Tax=Rhizoctonia solani TaxID=456999 RepID=A0A8H3DWT6_9AGAM|nr:unnamed protein product [Rhizoctonia solani]
MPLPSHVQRKKLAAVKAAAAKVSKIQKRPPHKPSPTSPVLQLSGDLSDAGRVWWNPYIGKTFLEWKKNRGNKYGAKGRLRGLFRKEWWDANLSEVEASKEDKIWYFDKTNIGTQIYAYVNNASVRNSAGRKLITPSTAIKTRAYGHDEWRRENSDIFNEALDAWKASRGDGPNVGEARALSSQLFKKLPEDEQDKWKEVARQRLAAARAHSKLTDPNDRLAYIEGFKETMVAQAKEGGAVCGVHMCTMLLYEKPDGKLKIERIISKELKGFGKTQAFGNSMIALQKWVEETAGKSVEGGPPAPCVYPDYSKDEYPCIPNYVGWKLEALQGLMRGYMSGVHRFQGAVGRVGWTEIAANPQKYIDPDRLPANLLLEIRDPSDLHMYIVVSFVDYFLCCHTSKIPALKIFQFKLIFAGSDPIHPSDSQETSRELVEVGGKAGWMLTFDQTVDKCHHPEGMNYAPGAHDYATYVANGFDSPRAACAAPNRWLSLPVAASGILDRVISTTEYEHYTALAMLLPESSRNRIIAILDAVNDHQHHLPASV